MNNKNVLSIIILNYNTCDLLRQCLNSLQDKEAEVTVVDNNSSDESVEMVKREFPRIKLIINPENYGFAKGNNRGMRKAKGEYILLLNSDTIVFPGTISKMIAFMEDHRNVGVATCKVELPDGTMDLSCHRGFPAPWAALTYFLGGEKLFPKSKIFAQYHQTYKDLNTVHEIDSPTGAFYLLRRQVIEEIGYLDEDYFMYGEDLDWSYRIKAKGWKIVYVPIVKVIHYKKRSGRESKDRKIKIETINHFYETMKIFYRKHYQEKYPKILLWLIFFFIDLKKKISTVFLDNL